MNDEIKEENDSAEIEGELEEIVIDNEPEEAIPDEFPEDIEKFNAFVCEYSDTNTGNDLDDILEDIEENEILKEETQAENELVDLQSDYSERLQQTPKNAERWVGGADMRGECLCILDDTEVNKYLDNAGVNGIEYKNCIPDFTPVSKGNVEIPEMSEDRLGINGNFKQADMILAEQRGCDWREVADWRIENKYTWHECNDRKTCQKIPSCINAKFGHLGGVAECRRAVTSDVEWEEEFDDI